ncbi:hypothetical protein EUGRSUZ_L01576 [Eucalyptus grandis]|uniref:Uncharacterized protein n=1 Tax=Eucalyptus grandis TaxID=71139 RepID=A0A058ZU21_EUCGR|nr:hypothetical protein EUGRSUZ_L01576 [Eucalyptus grandis]
MDEEKLNRCQTRARHVWRPTCNDYPNRVISKLMRVAAQILDLFITCQFFFLPFIYLFFSDFHFAKRN